LGKIAIRGWKLPKGFQMAKRQTHNNVEKKLKSLEKENKDLKQLVEKLQESEKKFKTIVENANDEIIYVGMDGTIIEINDKCEELFGLKRKEVIGKNFAEFGYFGPEDMEKAVEDFNNILKGGSPSMAEYRASRKDGRPVFIEVNPKLIKKDGEILGVLTIIRDITGRKQIEEELERYRDHLEELVKERTEDLEDKDLEYVEWAGEFKLASRLHDRLVTIASIEYVSQ
jgi:PAS domain S-box-containing protein